MSTVFKTWNTKLPIYTVKSTHHLEADQEAKDSVYTIFTMPSSKQDPIQITVTVDNCPVPMELYTGVSLSIIRKKVYQDTTIKPQTTAYLCSGLI